MLLAWHYFPSRKFWFGVLQTRFGWYIKKKKVLRPNIKPWQLSSHNFLKCVWNLLLMENHFHIYHTLSKVEDTEWTRCDVDSYISVHRCNIPLYDCSLLGNFSRKAPFLVNKEQLCPCTHPISTGSLTLHNRIGRAGQESRDSLVSLVLDINCDTHCWPSWVEVGSWHCTHWESL